MPLKTYEEMAPPLSQARNPVIATASAGKIEPKWFVFYTAPRAEKVAYNDLIRNEYQAFLPTTKSLRIWKNRQKKWIEEALFPGYIFVNTHIHEVHRIVRLPKIKTCIHCGGKPSVIRHTELDTIKRMLHHEENVVVERALFHEGEKVRVIKGPLAGCEGIMVKQKGKTRFGVQLEVINHTVLVDINIAMLENM
jgi:transcription antitermination factor NusG